HAGDTSNLILDPDLDSYYLMDATLLALPETQDRLAEVTARGEAVLKQAGITDLDRRQLAIFATLLKESDLDRVIGSVETALREDPNFYGISPSLQARVPPALQKYVDATEKFIALTRQLVDSTGDNFTAAEYAAAGMAARGASFELWRIADEEVDTLLQKRIDSYVFQRTRSLMVAAFALLAAVSFVTFITRSISGPLRQQAAQLKIANEALEAEVNERARAEEQLRRSEAQLAAAQKIARLGSWEWDVRSNEMVWSEENYRIHGFEPHEFSPSYEAVLGFIHPEDRGRSDVALKRALQEHKPFSFEQRILRRDGAERILYQCGEVALGADGTTAKVLGTAQDITDRKHHEEELETVHKELLEVSRQAGMAEVATGVLHNVGNVLNSVNVSAMLISDRLSKSKIAHLSNVSVLLREHEGGLGEFFTMDPKGRKLPGFIHSLTERLGAEQVDLLHEVEGLSKNIAHIKDIVAVQQSYAKVSGIIESLPSARLVEDALQMNAGALDRHGIDVIREFAETPPVRVDKHKVLQILINLIRNAKYATSESGLSEKRITARIAFHGASCVHIAIADNGVGIPPENLSRIFAHGFTTKSDGHGFGLHSSALAAAEMGGAIRAHSDGPGKGATFILELPIDESESSPIAVACQKVHV
ncbi:MAG TPA: ATP-binding protein, partial [Chthoniobacteraceae bacterium]